MEERSKRIWLVVGIIVVLAACCLIATAATVGGLMTLRRGGWTTDRGERGMGETSVPIERTFDVGREPSVTVDNFAGNVSVRRGEGGTIRVVATKRGSGNMGAAYVRVDISQEGDRVIVTTEGRPGLGSASVRIEITAPKETSLDLHSGAGYVSVEGTAGQVRAHSNAGAIRIVGVQANIEASTNAGNMDVQGVKGRVRLQTNAGAIAYDGQPSGDCDFQTNAGSITLELPADLDMEIDLSTDTGTVTVAHELGRTESSSRAHIRGTIGDGSGGEIRAHTNAGSVTVRERLRPPD